MGQGIHAVPERQGSLRKTKQREPADSLTNQSNRQCLSDEVNHSKKIISVGTPTMWRKNPTVHQERPRIFQLKEKGGAAKNSNKQRPSAFGMTFLEPWRLSEAETKSQAEYQL